MVLVGEPPRHISGVLYEYSSISKAVGRSNSSKPSVCRVEFRAVDPTPRKSLRAETFSGLTVMTFIGATDARRKKKNKRACGPRAAGREHTVRFGPIW